MSSPHSLSLTAVFMVALKRDLLLAYRRRHDLISPLAFFLMVAALFPLGVSPEPTFLADIAAGVLWIGALLSTLVSIDTLFRSDYDDGSLEQMLLSPQPLSLLVLAKVVAHWMVTGLPLTLMTPLLAVMLFLPAEGFWALLATLLIGTPTLSLVGAIGAGLTVGLRKGGVLITLLVLPLYIPVLIFGTGAVQAAINGLPINGYLAILGAILVLGVVLAPLAIAASLRISASQ